MELTIVYDNEAWLSGLHPDWGFSCLIQGMGLPTILFDTGAQGQILLSNMDRLGIDPRSIEMVFISHGHFDHTGGLSSLLKVNSDVQVVVPHDLCGVHGAREVVSIRDRTEIREGVFSTGELRSIEQSLVVRNQKGCAIIAGCSHPGVETILEAAAGVGRPYALIGGLHGFDHFEILQDLELICPTHCTRYKKELERLYPEKCADGGAGKTINL
jgi:7,8-dihydropterin-6-yl-methyl-4-(beta-D-ribofuranosyl)aminobenzene 5'-phosphate synthase